MGFYKELNTRVERDLKNKPYVRVVEEDSDKSDTNLIDLLNSLHKCTRIHVVSGEMRLYNNPDVAVAVEQYLKKGNELSIVAGPCLIADHFYVSKFKMKVTVNRTALLAMDYDNFKLYYSPSHQKGHFRFSCDGKRCHYEAPHNNVNKNRHSVYINQKVNFVFSALSTAFKNIVSHSNVTLDKYLQHFQFRTKEEYLRYIDFCKNDFKTIQRRMKEEHTPSKILSAYKHLDELLTHA